MSENNNITPETLNPDTGRTSKRLLSTREWVLILLILLVIEYVFLDKVFKYGSDSGLVSYLSFAGTLVSIVLAVLAIVYSYYQTFAQQKDSNLISNQIDILRKTVADVRVSKNEFTSELGRINDISDKLDQSMSLISESRTEFKGFSSAFDNLRQSFEVAAIKQSDNSDSTAIRPEQTENMFDQLNTGQRLVLYGLYKSQVEELPLTQRLRKYFADPYSQMDGKEFLQEWLEGYALGTAHFLSSYGLINRDENKIVINDNLITLIHKNLESATFIKSEKLNQVIEKINLIP